jgi:hypothetical protein
MKKFLIPLLLMGFTNSAKAEIKAVYLEPMLNGGIGTSSFSRDSTTMSFGGGLRMVLENDELFSGLEFNGAMNNLGIGDSGKTTTLGLTAGGTLTYIPIRLWFGLDVLDNYSDSLISAVGYGLRVGFNYFLNLRTCIGLQYIYHSYVTAPTTATNLTASIGAQSYNGVSLFLSMPLPLTQPKEPWKDKYLRHDRWKDAASQSTDPVSSEAATDSPVSSDDSGGAPQDSPELLPAPPTELATPPATGSQPDAPATEEPPSAEEPGSASEMSSPPATPQAPAVSEPAPGSDPDMPPPPSDIPAASATPPEAASPPSDPGNPAGTQAPPSTEESAPLSPPPPLPEPPSAPATPEAPSDSADSETLPPPPPN